VNAQAAVSRLGGVAILAGTEANAADLPRRAVYKAPPAPPPVVAPIYNWNGLYLGADIGIGWGSTTHSFSNGAPSDKSHLHGILGGGFVGYNYQITNWVFGVEGDLEAADLHGDFINTTGITSVGSSKLRRDASIRARAGVAWYRALFYATGGVAFAHYEFGGGPVPPPPCCGFSSNLTGWTVGVGLEYAFLQNLIARVEYRHSDYGHITAGLTPIFPDVLMTTRNTTDVVRFGLAYKFDIGKGKGPAPVVAKY